MSDSEVNNPSTEEVDSGGTSPVRKRTHPEHVNPPASMQTSNHMAEGLDFGSGDGGQIPQGAVEPTDSQSDDISSPESIAKKPRLDLDFTEDQMDCTEMYEQTSIINCAPQGHIARPRTPEPVSPVNTLDTRELEIIDELGNDFDDETSDTYRGENLNEDEGLDNGSDDLSDDDDDLDDDEIYAWLEEGIELSKKRPSDGDNRGENSSSPICREKVVLKERGHDPFEILPEGWVTVTHNSGMPVYLHKHTRVCTMSKPYFLGPGSARKHDIPTSAVPCLHYWKELEKERLPPIVENAAEAITSTMENTTKCSSSVPTHEQSHLNGQITDGEPSSGPVNRSVHPDSTEPGCGLAVNFPSESDSTSVPVPMAPAVNGSLGAPVKIESAEERKKITSLSPLELREYCRKRFEFKVITVKKFKTWKDRRRHHSLMKKQSRPGLPGNTKLITCPIASEKGDDKKKEFVLNPSGKSFVCILHEYVQHAMRVQPRYVFKELENAQTPYSATVIISDVEYGTGYASSKKAAKMDAAKSTLAILIPEMVKVTQEENRHEPEDLSFFDEIKIEDPRIYELCSKAGQPSPYQILQECLKRNYGMGDTQCQMDMKQLKHQKNEFIMTVGKHTTKVVCKNKREGKQYAAQAILQLLHPHVQSWGSLLRLYGRGSCNAIREKKQEEQSITHLQVNAKSNRPNTAVLDKLRVEMTKLQGQREAIKSKGKLTISSNELPVNVASIDL